MADVLVLPTIATLVGLVLVWRIGRSRYAPELLLLVTFVIGLLGLVLTALLPWPQIGEFLVFSAMGGMVAAAVIWFGRRRRLT